MIPLAKGKDSFDPARATVWVVDDDPSVRRSLALLIHSAGLQAEECASAQEFLDRYQPERPGCLILDVRMPGMSGLELQAKRDLGNPWPPTIFVTAHGELPLATQAMRAGAIDFIQKPFDPHVLLERIREALALDKSSRSKRTLACGLQNRLATLTARELEVARLLAAGESTKRIASQLVISPKTVDNHRAKILEKLQVDNPTQLSHLFHVLD